MIEHEQDRARVPLLLTAAEAARILNISPSMVRKLTSAGQLPSVRLGAAVRIPVEQLRAWIHAHTTPPPFSQNDSTQD